MELQIFRKLDEISYKISEVDKRITRIENKIDESLMITRNHLVRVKNKQQITDSSILLGSPYNDLAPQQAFSIFNNEEIDFVLVDVSTLNHSQMISGAKKIPLEELASRVSELPSGSFPIMVISEKGIRSIKACEILVTKGFFNTNNISGGHQCWPGHKEDKLEGDISSDDLPPEL
tara:strand:- start:154 stop:681 length:528 start_codon:yes stop_codon:yes gene_type:complete